MNSKLTILVTVVGFFLVLGIVTAVVVLLGQYVSPLDIRNGHGVVVFTVPGELRVTSTMVLICLMLIAYINRTGDRG